MTFREIRQHGNRLVHGGHLNNVIACRDGFRFSVLAGWGTHCCPRPEAWPGPEDYAGPYIEVEVGFWGSRLPAPARAWRPYREASRISRRGAANAVTLYGYVPVRLVYDLIRLHGGEVPAVGVPWDLTARIERVQRNKRREWALLSRTAQAILTG